MLGGKKNKEGGTMTGNRAVERGSKND